MKIKNKTISYSLLFIGFTILISGIVGLGVFDSNKILVKTLVTTGPDFGVVLGKIKLNIQTTDYNEKIDNSGVMLTDDSLKSIDSFLQQNWKVFSNGDYILFDYEIISIKKSDSNEFHPLIKINSYQLISFLKYWSVVFIVITIFFLAIHYYRKQKTINNKA